MRGSSPGWPSFATAVASAAAVFFRNCLSWFLRMVYEHGQAYASRPVLISAVTGSAISVLVLVAGAHQDRENKWRDFTTHAAHSAAFIEQQIERHFGAALSMRAS